MKPTSEILAEMRAIAHRDIDAIFDALPLILDHRGAPHRDRPQLSTHDAERLNDPNDHRIDPAAIRAIGDRTDPTGQSALKTNPADEWATRVRGTLRQLQKLTAQVDSIIGPPVCLNCRKEIRPEQRTRRRSDQTQHERCSPWQRDLPQAA